MANWSESNGVHAFTSYPFTYEVWEDGFGVNATRRNDHDMTTHQLYMGDSVDNAKRACEVFDRQWNKG